MRIRARSFVAGSGVLALAVVVTACVTTSSSRPGGEGGDDGGGGWSYDGPRSACSTGRVPDDEDIPPEPEAAVSAPECIARCGVEKGTFGHYGTVWTTDALPRGDCKHDGEICRMSAVRAHVCEDGEKIACSLTGYACRCESGAWRCYHGPRGRSACICPDLDASADAAGAEGTDAASD